VKNIDLIYSKNHNSFFDKIILKKRFQIIKIINDKIKDQAIHDALDIGTTADENNKSSNIIIKNLKNIKFFKCISDQEINSVFFKKKLKKSITSDFSNDEIKEFSSDLVVSNATIEHVGGLFQQKKMISNIIKLTKKTFIVSTPNRFHPFEFHTKIPLIHWLPKEFHRKILEILGISFYAKKKNLNLLSKNDLIEVLKSHNITYEIKFINFLFFKSNLIVIGKKNKKTITFC
tara:strand:- start:25 stop:720 length:696 start_codon:yes stop_codon:yes gene_type:complete